MKIRLRKVNIKRTSEKRKDANIIISNILIFIDDTIADKLLEYNLKYIIA